MKNPPGVANAAGSTIKSIHTARGAKVYAVFEAEIESIGMMNAVSNLSLAGGMSFIGFWFALYLERQVTPDATPEGEVLLTVGPIVCGAGALVLFLIALAAWWKRGAIIKKIKSEAIARNDDLESDS